jgi:hypothetical protein
MKEVMKKKNVINSHDQKCERKKQEENVIQRKRKENATKRRMKRW